MAWSKEKFEQFFYNDIKNLRSCLGLDNINKDIGMENDYLGDVTTLKSNDAIQQSRDTDIEGDIQSQNKEGLLTSLRALLLSQGTMR